MTLIHIHENIIQLPQFGRRFIPWDDYDTHDTLGDGIMVHGMTWYDGENIMDIQLMVVDYHHYSYNWWTTIYIMVKISWNHGTQQWLSSKMTQQMIHLMVVQSIFFIFPLVNSIGSNHPDKISRFFRRLAQPPTRMSGDCDLDDI